MLRILWISHDCVNSCSQLRMQDAEDFQSTTTQILTFCTPTLVLLPYRFSASQIWHLFIRLSICLWLLLNIWVVWIEQANQLKLLGLFLNSYSIHTVQIHISLKMKRTLLYLSLEFAYLFRWLYLPYFIIIVVGWIRLRCYRSVLIYFFVNKSILWNNGSINEDFWLFKRVFLSKNTTSIRI